MPSALRFTQPQQLRLSRPGLPARAALHIEHRRLDRHQFPITLDQTRHRQRREMAALALRHPDVATRGFQEVPEPGVPVVDRWTHGEERNGNISCTPSPKDCASSRLTDFQRDDRILGVIFRSGAHPMPETEMNGIEPRHPRPVVRRTLAAVTELLAAVPPAGTVPFVFEE